MTESNSNLTGKYADLLSHLAGHGKAAVAFSGGVDSTLLLRAAAEALPGKVVALLAATPLQPDSELSAALATAQAIGVEIVVRHLDPLSWPEFVANPRDRCYHCKKTIYSDFIHFLHSRPDYVLMDGTNVDDLQEDRPGRRALKELGVATPLVSAKLSKLEIRNLSKTLQLATWDKPSASCLATRITSELPVTSARLALIDRCEAYLRGLGIVDCRVRLASPSQVHIELLASDFEKLSRQEVRTQVLFFYKSLGLQKVLLDLSERKGKC